MDGLSFASLNLFALFIAFVSGQQKDAVASGISSRTGVPLFNIRPPLPILNGSTYSTLAPTGTRPRLLTPGVSTGSAASATNVATYNGHIFPTLCRESDTACLTTCQSFAHSCSADFNSWSALRRSHQSSMADQLNGGSMPLTTSHHIQTEEGTTILKYETSWLEYELTTTVEGWEAGSLGMTTATLTGDDGRMSTSAGFKSGMMDVTYTTSVPIAVGGSGTPISTSEAHYNTFTFQQTSWYDFTVPKPTCSPSSWTECRYSSDCNKCTISGGTVQLLYFPVPTTKGAEKSPSPSATTTTPTALETAIYKNITLTSPSVYISFQTAYAQNDCGTQVGKRYPGAILPLPLSDLSSVYGGYGTLYSSDPLAPLGAVSNTPYLAAGQFHLADLNWPPPMSAYTNQLKFALGREIFSIMTQPYNPHLAVPSQVRDLDPAWASCGLDWEGLYDPPSALQPASVAVKPTLSSAASSIYTSAVPHSSLSSVPAETATSQEAAFVTRPASAKSTPEQSSSAESTQLESQVETASTNALPAAGTSAVLIHASSEAGRPEPLQSTQKPSTPAVTGSTPAQASPTVDQQPTASESTRMPVSDVEPQDAVDTDVTTKTLQTSAAPWNVPASDEADAVSADSAELPTDPSTTVAAAIGTSIEGGRSAPSTPAAQSWADGQPTSGTKSQPDSSVSDPAVTAPLVVAIGSQTVTEGGSVQTVSNEIISLAATEIVIGSSAIGIPRIQAGTQPISLPAGEDARLMGMTFIAGESRSQVKPSTTAPEPKATFDAATLDSTIPRAVFTFGTRTYTAVQTGGTREAVIGQTTLTAGAAVSLDGGTVSLVSGHLQLQPDETETFEGPELHQQPSTTGSKGFESNSSTSAEPVSSTTASVTRPSGSEIPGVTTASTTTSSGAQRLWDDRGLRVVLAVFLLSSLWH